MDRATEEMFYVYILECDDGSYYIGQTYDLRKRIAKHNSYPTPQMKSRLPVKLFAYKEVSSRSESVKLERYLKSLKKREAVLRYTDSNFTRP